MCRSNDQPFVWLTPRARSTSRFVGSASCARIMAAIACIDIESDSYTLFYIEIKANRTPS